MLQQQCLLTFICLCQPHFTGLSKLWAGFQDEMVLLSILNNMVVSLRPFLTAQSHLLLEGQLEAMLDGADIKSDDDRLKESAGGQCSVQYSRASGHHSYLRTAGF